MNTAFPRIITLLRKERGVSQKQAAEALQVSQALLSHYEKGIRECGLDFVTRVADYYNVSCDYLLGRTADKSGAIITAEELPEGDPTAKDNKFRGSVLPVLNKKLVMNSLNIIFDVLQKCDNKHLTTEASAYLSIAVYTVFRALYSGNPRNSQSMFSVQPFLFHSHVSGEMSRTLSILSHLAAGNKYGNYTVQNIDNIPLLSSDSVSGDYPLFAASLFNLLKNAEQRINGAGGV